MVEGKTENVATRFYPITSGRLKQSAARSLRIGLPQSTALAALTSRPVGKPKI